MTETYFFATNQQQTIFVRDDEVPPQDQSKINLERLVKKFFWIEKQLVREFLAELFGTTLLVLFGCASVAQFNLVKLDPELNPSLLTINLSFGFAVMLAVLVTFKTSGGQLNPAVSLATLLIGKMSLLRFLIYSCAQFIGAFVGAAIVFITYLDALKSTPEIYSLENAAIFSTYPNKNLSILGGIFDQAIGTFLLITVYLATADRRNSDGISWTFGALIMGITVTVIGMAFGYNSAYAINPARDFAPRLFSLIVGWGSKTFTAGNYFFWIPLVVPMLASFIAVFVYLFFIQNTKNCQLL